MKIFKHPIFWFFVGLVSIAQSAVVYNYFSPGGALSGNATSQNVNVGAGSPFITGVLPAANSADNGANPTASLGLSAINGTATTWMRSDGAPALSQSISPTMTGNWIFTPSIGTAVTINDVTALPSIINGANSATGNALSIIGNFTGTGTINLLTLIDINNTNGSTMVFISGGATPKKYLRVANGIFQVLNNAFSTAILGISDSGGITMPGLASSSAATTGTQCWTTSTGNLTVDTTTTCLASTIKVKQHIESLDSGLSEVMKLHPVSYELKPEFNPAHLGRQTGLIAEEVIKIDPRLVALDNEGDPRSVRYQQLTAVLVKAIQDQQHEIDELKRRLR